MKCTCGLEVVIVERKMACPDCGSELILSYDSELAELRARLEARCARLAAALEWYADIAHYRMNYELESAYGQSWRIPLYAKIITDKGQLARSALIADDRALAERWRAMEEEHRTCQEWLSFIEAHDNDADADWESLESENVKRELAWRAAVRAVSALAASLGG